MFWLFGLKACGILIPQSEFEPSPPALEAEVLTTGPPGEGPNWDYFSIQVLLSLNVRNSRHLGAITKKTYALVEIK